MNKTVCVVTGSRAEQGLLYWLMKGIQAEPSLTLQLIVTGSHLDPKLGNTINSIYSDGFTPDRVVDINAKGSTQENIIESLSVGLKEISKAYAELKPDIIFLLGDRYEIFASALAAYFLKIPIAHIHGGELSEGSFDDGMRHSITKLAQLHFTAAEPYRKRVIQLGENPRYVWNIGAMACEHTYRSTLFSAQSLESDLDIRLTKPLFMVTYHPHKAHSEKFIHECTQIFNALDTFENALIIFTAANADAGGEDINQNIQNYVERNKTKAFYFPSLGAVRYLSLMKHASAVIGNSSSGIIEAPLINIPTVNIGERQKGRLSSPSVVNCAMAYDSICEAITTALSPAHLEKTQKGVSPYWHGSQLPSEAIISVFKEIDLSELTVKSFYDITY